MHWNTPSDVPWFVGSRSRMDQSRAASACSLYAFIFSVALASPALVNATILHLAMKRVRLYLLKYVKLWKNVLRFICVFLSHISLKLQVADNLRRSSLDELP